MSSSPDRFHTIKDTSKYIEFLELNLTKENYSEYISILEDYANRGDLESILQLSNIYKFGDEFTEPNFIFAIEILKKSFANFNSSQIASEIAEIYWLWMSDDSENEDSNNKEAVRWYEIAAKFGDAESCERLGGWYRFGIRVEENLDKAIEYFDLAINYGSKNSYNELADLYLKNFSSQSYIDKAVKLLCDGSVQGDEVSQYMYSVHLEEGEIVKQDKKEALMWLEKSALAGYSPAQVRIANKHLESDSLERNLYKAFGWLEQAALNHYLEAQIHLHNCYLIGAGVEKNLTQALAWLLIGLRNDRYNEKQGIKNIFTPVCYRLIESMPEHHINQAKKIANDFIKNSSHYYTEEISDLED